MEKITKRERRKLADAKMGKREWQKLADAELAAAVKWGLSRQSYAEGMAKLNKRRADVGLPPFRARETIPQLRPIFTGGFGGILNSSMGSASSWRRKR
jgi:hypothetical protein